eukprot:TRINITY_DN2573_c0_g1_i2.p1 TRINITY_DN2573_c0_g1~~TRINITY_DN2573_c0_g1_i2.p1  ORF type:complete len:663 (+),score=111.71 TRINITY_DN2573_c0_g1_i2:45-1991(+)
MNNPFGANGILTRVGEHIPGVNNAIQELHKAAGQHDALRRAKKTDPLGSDGALTKLAERIPLVNQGVQELHHAAGNKESLARAKRRNPLGADGYITKIGEHIPGINDGIMALHIRAGRHDLAEQTKARTLQGMLSKDGVLTKLSELLPGSNLVAAAIHEAEGNKEEAARARDLVKNWKKAGSADGPLAKLAELLPAVDVVAFGLHLNAGNYAQALRSITKTSWVNMEISSVSIVIRTQSLKDLIVSHLFAESVDLSPFRASTMGGLYDIARHSLKLSKAGGQGTMKTELLHRLRSLMNQKIGASVEGGLQQLPNLAQKQVRSFTIRLQKIRNEVMPKMILDRALQVASYMNPSTVGSSQCQAERWQRWLVSHINSHLPNEFPMPQEKYMRTLHESILRIGASHGKGFEYRHEYKGFIACGTHTGMLGCLSGLIAGLVKSSQLARDRTIAWLNQNNANAWQATNVPGSSRHDALLFQLPRDDFVKSRRQAYRYVWDQLLNGREACKLAARLASFWLSTWADDLEGDASLPLLIEVEVPVIQACDRKAGSALDTTLPSFQAVLIAEVGMCDGTPKVQNLQLAIKEDSIHCMMESVRCQLEDQDLRSLHPGFAGFAQPIHAAFELKSLDWQRADEVKLTFSSLRSRLHLPQ